MGGAAKAVKKVVKSTVKVVKSVTKSVSKVVKKVAKSVVSVGKSIVKGVGKITSKLGPLASVALMAIPGFQAFGASLASGLGFSSTLAANIATGAMTGFITSGGDLKATVMGGALSGAGSYLGSAVKGAAATGSLSQGFAQANQAMLAPNAFTGGLTGSAGFSAGIDAAKTEWGNFTTKVGNFLSGGTNNPTDITAGTAKSVQAQNLVDKNTGMTFDEAMNKVGYDEASWRATPESMYKSDFAATVQEAQRMGTYDPTTSYADYYTSRIDEMSGQLLKTGVDPSVIQEQLSFGATLQDKAASLQDLMQSSGVAGSYVTGPTGEVIKNPYWEVADKYNVTPGSEQHRMLLEQEYENFQITGPDSVSYDPALSFDEGVKIGARPVTQPAQPKGPDTDKLRDLAKGLLAPTASTAGSGLSFITSVGAGDLASGQAGKTGGASGMLGYSDIVRQQQGLLVAQAERQAEEARQRALKGWSIA